VLVGPDLPVTGAAGLQLTVTTTPAAMLMNTPVSAMATPILADPSVTDGVIIWGIALVLVVVIGTLGFILSQKPKPHRPAR